MPVFSHVVPMMDGSTYRVTRLLAKASQNTKTNKSEKSGNNIMTVSLSLAPANVSGFNLCTSSSAGCRADCLFTAGRAIVNPRQIQPGRIAKARMLRLFPETFYERLVTELTWAKKRATRSKQRLYVRLNVLSDVFWEREFPSLLPMFPDVTFYDYTKHYKRMLRFVEGELPRNMHLTFSWSGTNLNQCLKILEMGGNVAVPFNVKYSWAKGLRPLPTTFYGYPVTDGDVTDLRPLDPQGGYVVGLRAKGKAKKDVDSGFVVQVEQAAKTGVISWM